VVFGGRESSFPNGFNPFLLLPSVVFFWGYPFIPSIRCTYLLEGKAQKLEHRV